MVEHALEQRAAQQLAGDRQGVDQLLGCSKDAITIHQLQ
jgi:hypothetical protein